MFFPALIRVNKLATFVRCGEANYESASIANKFAGAGSIDWTEIALVFIKQIFYQQKAFVFGSSKHSRICFGRCLARILCCAQIWNLIWPTIKWHFKGINPLSMTQNHRIVINERAARFYLRAPGLVYCVRRYRARIDCIRICLHWTLWNSICCEWIWMRIVDAVRHMQRTRLAIKC